MPKLDGKAVFERQMKVHWQSHLLASGSKEQGGTETHASPIFWDHVSKM